MRNIMLTVLLSSSLATLPLQAAVWQGEGTATFSVRATGHTVHGEVGLKPFRVKAETRDGDTLLSWANDVETLKMGTDNKKRDVEMHHVLHAEAFPLIHGEVAQLSMNALKTAPADKDTPMLFPIQFSMAGARTDKEATVMSCEETADGVRLKVAFDVSQLEHGLKPIRKMGFLKVKDTVHVEVQFTLTP